MSSTGQLERYGIRFAIERADTQRRAWTEAKRKSFTMNQAAECLNTARAWESLREVAASAMSFLLTEDVRYATAHANRCFTYGSKIRAAYQSVERSHGFRPHDAVILKAWESVQEAAQVGEDIEKFVRARTLIEGVGP